MSWFAEIVADVVFMKLFGEMVSSNLMPVVFFRSFSMSSTVFGALFLFLVVSFLLLCGLYRVFNSRVIFLVCGMNTDKARSQVR